MAINTYYSNYYNYNSLLFGNTSSANNTNSIYSLLNSNYSASKASYGKNNANSLSALAQDFLTSSKTQSENLKTAMYSLLGKDKKGVSVFDQKTAVSSDTSALSIKSLDQKNTAIPETTVDIKQIATTQKNAGAALKAAGKGFTTGFYQFEIEAGGKKTQVSFNVSSSDNNQTIQQKMADAINSKNVGVVASVSYDSDKKTSSLVLESATTGAEDNGKEKFKIRDMYGGAVATTGVGSITQEAQNAVYSVNGGAQKVSKTNNVDIGNGVTATLKKSDSKVTVKMGTDETSAINKVRDMVNAYNGLLEAAENNKNDKRTNSLLKELKGAANTYSSSLNRIGISLTEDGYMKIDEDKMKKASESGELKAFFTGDGKYSNYGFSYRMTKIAENVSNDPSSYVSKTQPISASSYNPSYNYLQSFKMSQISNVGLLFDYLL